MLPAYVGVASAAAVGTYLDARLGILEDIRELYYEWKGRRVNDRARRTGRASPWYRFEQQVGQLPREMICLWTPEAQYTWLEVHDRACQYAQFFLSLGVAPGQMIAMYLRNRAEYVFAALGAWAIGCAPAGINHNLTDEGLVHCLKISHTKVVLVDWDDDCQAGINKVRDRVEGELGMTVVVLSDEFRERLNLSEVKAPDETLAATVTIDSPLYLQYTSGSTGYPKAVCFPISRGSMLSFGPMKERMRLRSGPDGDRWYVPMPLYHGTGFVIAVSCLVNGFTLCLSLKFSASRFWNEVRASKATAFVYVGEAPRYLLSNPPSPQDMQHGIRLMWGNGMRPDVWRRFVERFGIETVMEFYNSSEGVLALDNRCQGPFREFAVGHQGLLRRMLTRNSYVPARVDIETGELWRDAKSGFAQSLPWDVGGEILVRCKDETDFIGYYMNSEASKKKFERNVFEAGDLFYRTGDALRRTKDGLWFFQDRLGDTFRWRSENVAAAEVAQVLGLFPGIVDVSVYGVHVPGHDGRAGCAALFLNPKGNSEAAVIDWAAFLNNARAKLPKYAVPVFLRLLSKPSLTGNAKQNKVPLKKDGVDLNAIAQSAQASGTPVDKMLWWPAGLGMSAAPGPEKTGGEFDKGYVEYTMKDWAKIQVAAGKL